jgi:hypothetical protein
LREIKILLVDDEEELVSVEETGSGGRIQFEGLEGLISELADTFPSDRETALLGMLKAEHTVSAEEKKLILYLPKQHVTFEVSCLRPTDGGDCFWRTLKGQEKEGKNREKLFICKSIKQINKTFT